MVAMAAEDLAHLQNDKELEDTQEAQRRLVMLRGAHRRKMVFRAISRIMLLSDHRWDVRRPRPRADKGRRRVGKFFDAVIEDWHNRERL